MNKESQQWGRGHIMVRVDRSQREQAKKPQRMGKVRSESYGTTVAPERSTKASSTGAPGTCTGRQRVTWAMRGFGFDHDHEVVYFDSEVL